MRTIRIVGQEVRIDESDGREFVNELGTRTFNVADDKFDDVMEQISLLAERVEKVG